MQNLPRQEQGTLTSTTERMLKRGRDSTLYSAVFISSQPQAWYVDRVMVTPVSVIVPTYNQAILLSETVDSILSQSYPPEEIIILDDGSTDDTAAVVSRMSAKVKYHHKPNGGICAARNAGVSFAKSNYIAFCDHDDLWKKDKLAQQMDLHDSMPDLKYSFTNFATVSDGMWSEKTKFDQAPPDFFDSSFKPVGSNMISDVSLYEKLLQFQPIFPSTTVMKKSLYESLGGANEKFGKNPAEDWDLTLRCVLQPPIGIVRDPVVGIRKHASNFSGSSARNALGRIEILNHAILHHPVGESTKQAIRRKIFSCQVEASYDAFDRGDFDSCRELLSAVPGSQLTSTLWLKLLISSCPKAIAKPIHSLLPRH